MRRVQETQCHQRAMGNTPSHSENAKLDKLRPTGLKPAVALLFQAPLHRCSQRAQALHRRPNITNLVCHVSRILPFVGNSNYFRGEMAEEAERLEQLINVRRKLRSTLDH